MSKEGKMEKSFLNFKVCQNSSDLIFGFFLQSSHDPKLTPTRPRTRNGSQETHQAHYT